MSQPMIPVEHCCEWKVTGSPALPHHPQKVGRSPALLHLLILFCTLSTNSPISTDDKSRFLLMGSLEKLSPYVTRCIISEVSPFRE